MPPLNSPEIPARSETRWYQVPLLWMCLALFVLMLVGCIHLIVISMQFDNAVNTSGNAEKVTQGAFFRMPLTRQGASDENPHQELAPPDPKETGRVDASESN